MKRPLSTVIFGVTFLWFASRLFGEPTAADVKALLESRPALHAAITEYQMAETMLNAEIEPAMKAAREKYVTALQAILNRYNDSKRLEDADRVREEIKRFERHDVNAEPSKDSPGEVRSEWSKLLKEIDSANQKMTLKRSALRSKFGQNLTAIEQQLRAEGDEKGIALAQRARACPTIRLMIETGRLTSTAVAGKSHEQWQDVVVEGGYLVGFEAGTGGWFQFTVTGGLKPIFATASGFRDGKKRGNHGGNRVIAKDGYAVGGLMVRSGEVVDSVQIVFMRISPGGLSLNPQDSYLSDWLGGGGKGAGREISARGRLVIGVTGRTGDVVEGIGLIHLR